MQEGQLFSRKLTLYAVTLKTQLESWIHAGCLTSPRNTKAHMDSSTERSKLRFSSLCWISPREWDGNTRMEVHPSCRCWGLTTLGFITHGLYPYQMHCIYGIWPIAVIANTKLRNNFYNIPKVQSLLAGTSHKEMPKMSTVSR